jgi:hypothetical protein
MMDADGAPLLGELHIAGQRRWRVEPRYANTGLTRREEDVLYFLEYLPPEVEWAFWVVDKNLMRIGDKLVPRSTQPRSLEWLHAWAEEDALLFADEAARRREEDRTKPWRDRMKIMLSLWKWVDTVDGEDDLVQYFVPPGYSLWLWGRPRHEPASPTFHLKRSERASRLEERLAGLSIEQYLAEAAKEAGYSFEEFVASLPRRRPTKVEKKRHAALAETMAELCGAGAKQKDLAEATGLSQNQVSRLKNAHLQGKS